jgi:hypothetical protein
MEVSSQAADYNIVLPPASPVQAFLCFFAAGSMMNDFYD